VTEREILLTIFEKKQPPRLPKFLSFDVITTPPEHSMNFPENGPDWFGVQWYVDPATKTQVVQPGFRRLENITGWREIMPDVDSIDWEAAGKAAQAKMDRENKVSMVWDASGHFERLHYLLGFEESLTTFYDYPEELEAFFEALTELKIQVIRRVKKYYNPDIFSPHDDWGTNLNMFFAPALWRKFLKPYIKRLVDACHEEGMLFCQHTCGYVTPVLDDLVEIGVDIAELQACNDLGAFKKRHGNNILLQGCFNSQVLNRPGLSVEEARASARKTLMDCAIGGGFCSTAWGVPGITPETRAAIADEIDKFNREYYGWTGE